MRIMHAGALTALCAVSLTACTEGPLAPRDARLPVSASLMGCDRLQPSRGVASQDFPVGSLPGVTVTAAFGGGALPWNMLQSMMFPLGSGADRAPCISSPTVTYVVDTLRREAIEPLPVPDGVDAEFWNSLSPREQRVLLAQAELYMKLYPNRFPSAGSVINNFFRERILRSKTESKVRANDFFGGTSSAEMLAGGIYGCQLYRDFSQDPQWHLLNDETLRLVIELVTAFAEAEFAWSPLRGLRFGRNGTFGAATAKEYTGGLDCGQLVFNSIRPDRIVVTDPYEELNSVPPSGGGLQPPASTPPTMPPGWYDY